VRHRYDGETGELFLVLGTAIGCAAPYLAGQSEEAAANSRQIRMYWWQVGSFIRDADVRHQFVPLLYQQFDATPSARPAFFRLNKDLLPTVQSRTQMIQEFRRPVRIIFGDADPSLNSGVARPRVFPGLRTIPHTGCSTFRPTG
jgi:hypothetical protein